jgi:DNA-binding transcriptional MerR regulator
VPENTPKASGAFRTIGELSSETGLPPHILRYWETRFPQLRPLTRAGNRRYYRPQDVALVRRIDRLLNHEGYTVRGVQQLLARGAPAAEPSVEATPALTPPAADLTLALRAIRDLLAAALAEDLA